MRRSFTDMDDMLRNNSQPIKRAKQTPGEYDTCNDPECQICIQWLEHKHKYSLTRIAYQMLRKIQLTTPCIFQAICKRLFCSHDYQDINYVFLQSVW